MNELKELLKPPYKWDMVSFSSATKLDLLRVGSSTNFPENKIYDDFRNFVAEALNEKYVRDFAEPKKWLKGTVNNEMITGDVYICPECKADYNFKAFNFCPNCGIKLQAE